MMGQRVATEFGDDVQGLCPPVDEVDVVTTILFSAIVVQNRRDCLRLHPSWLVRVCVENSKKARVGKF